MDAFVRNYFGDDSDRGVLVDTLFDHARLLKEPKKTRAKIARLTEAFYQIREIEEVEPGLITKNSEMKNLIERVKMIARCDSHRSMLIIGGTGTGKEVFAKLFADNSPRKKFLPININDIPEELFDSELFGHKKGAFTGAVSDKQGLIEAMDGGVLFLDEIGDLAYHLQTKLLRAIREQQIRRLGETEFRSINVIFIFATNVNVFEKAKQGKFRADLLNRMDETLFLPAITHRKDDIQILWQHFLATFGRNFVPCIKGFSKGVSALLEGYSWPGNVEEIRRVAKSVLLDLELENRDATLPRYAIRESDVLKYIGPKKEVINQIKKVLALNYQEAVLNFKKNLLFQAQKEGRGDGLTPYRYLEMKRSTYYDECRKCRVV